MKYNFESGGNEYQTPPEIYKPILELELENIDMIGIEKSYLCICFHWW